MALSCSLVATTSASCPTCLIDVTEIRCSDGLRACNTVENHPDVQGDRVEAIEHVSEPNMTGFGVFPGEVKEIDAPS